MVNGGTGCGVPGWGPGGGHQPVCKRGAKMVQKVFCGAERCRKGAETTIIFAEMVQKLCRFGAERVQKCNFLQKKCPNLQTFTPRHFSPSVSCAK